MNPNLTAKCGLADARDELLDPAAPVTPSAIGPGIHFKGDIRGEGTLTIHGVFEGDIVLDGTLQVGPEGRIDANVTARSIVIAGVVRGRFLYSGGIGSLQDLERLAALRQVNLGGVIVGKALYEGRFTIREAQRALET